MGAKSKGLGGAKSIPTGNASELAPHENPLVRNETLRQMYQKMVEARLLEEHVLQRQRKKKHGGLEPSVGQEACRVGLVQGLASGDVVMDCRAGGLTGHLLGAKLQAVLDVTQSALDRKSATPAGGGDIAKLLPFVVGAEPRLFAAMGAGLLMKSMQQKNVVVVYAQANEATKTAWMQVLKRSGELDLPIIFVVLLAGAKHGGKADSRVCGWAQKSGVPGIPVDASDAVALYRVAQESMGRMRGDGGPVLIACIPFRMEGAKQRVEDDPIAQLRSFLLGRKICTQAWMNGVERRFREKLKIAEVVRP